jgi:hypothetical protein
LEVSLRACGLCFPQGTAQCVQKQTAAPFPLCLSVLLNTLLFLAGYYQLAFVGMCLKPISSYIMSEGPKQPQLSRAPFPTILLGTLQSMSLILARMAGSAPGSAPLVDLSSFLLALADLGVSQRPLCYRPGPQDGTIDRAGTWGRARSLGHCGCALRRVLEPWSILYSSFISWLTK